MYVLFMPISLVRELQTKIEEEVGVDFHKIISEADNGKVGEEQNQMEILVQAPHALDGVRDKRLRLRPPSLVLGPEPGDIGVSKVGYTMGMIKLKALVLIKILPYFFALPIFPQLFYALPHFSPCLHA